MLVLGIDAWDLSLFPFHGVPASTKCFIRNTIPSFNQLLIITILRWYVLVSKTEKSCWFSSNRQKESLRHRVYSNSKGILTFFPFPLFQLGTRLGLTYSWLNCIVKKPLPFRWQWFSHCYDPTTARILILARSTPPYEDASALTKRLPTANFTIAHGIGS